MRAALLILAIFVLPVAGWKVHQSYERSRVSTFALWDFNAAMSFEALDDQAAREQKRRFVCHPMADVARFCELKSTGIRGVMRVLVDGQGRAAIIQFMPDSADPIMREEGRRIAAAWNLVGARETDIPDPKGPTRTVTRWTGAEGRWTAAMTYGRLKATPSLIALADEAAVAEIRASSPLAPLVMGVNGLIDPDAAEDLLAIAMGPIMLGRHVAVDSVNGTIPPPTPATRPAVCDPVTVEPVVPGTNAITSLGGSMATLLEAAIPTVYPGRRLVLGDGIWIVDANGFSERFQLHTQEHDVDSDVFAFGVGFPARVRVADDRLRARTPATQCRAHAELLLVSRGENRTMAGAQRVVVDDEAVLSDISRFHFIPPLLPNDQPGMTVQYGTGYGTDQWVGSLEWIATIAGDPPRTTLRLPIGYSFESSAGRDAASGFLLATKRTADSIEFATYEQNAWGAATRTISVPLADGGVLRGATLLEHLLPPAPATPR